MTDLCWIHLNCVWKDGVGGRGLERSAKGEGGREGAWRGRGAEGGSDPQLHSTSVHKKTGNAAIPHARAARKLLTAFRENKTQYDFFLRVCNKCGEVLRFYVFDDKNILKFLGGGKILRTRRTVCATGTWVVLAGVVLQPSSEGENCEDSVKVHACGGSSSSPSSAQRFRS